MNIRDEILASKRSEVESAQELVSADEMCARARVEAADEPVRGLRSALAAAPAPAVIAELKRRSPSKGEIRPGLDPATCAREYAAGGAAALSILTDERYFGGHLAYLREARRAVDLPILRKDFVVDAYQIDESRVAGADAILLIVSALGAEELGRYRDRAASLGLDCLVEVHDEAELDIALDVGADLIGINNRDLTTFEVDLNYSHIKSSLGNVDDEKGFRWRVIGAADYVNGDTIPKFFGKFDFGFPLWWKHSSLWFRNSAGVAFGEVDDELRLMSLEYPRQVLSE